MNVRSNRPSPENPSNHREKTMNTIRRFRIGLTALSFLAIGVAFWIAPERTAGYFGIITTGGHGLVSVCADLGGLFFGMGLLAGFGTITRRRGPLRAAATMLGAVALGRVVGWLSNHGAPIGTRELSIEVGTMCALLLLARRPASETTVETRRAAG